MMGENRFEQEYRKLKHQAAPDLWDRIEANLKEHPERMQNAQQEHTEVSKVSNESDKVRSLPSRKAAYGVAAAAAAVVVLLAAAPQMEQIRRGGMAAVTGAAKQEAGVKRADAMDQAAVENETAVMSASAAAWQPLTVPEQAVTVPEDARYFSEAVLGDTELLCGGTVQSASFEEDESGRPVRVVYELSLDQVYYAEDYTTGMDSITVKSPIIKTEGDEVFVLYQLMPGDTYLLPLKKQEAGWELLYPFAPQIQVTWDGAYLFHSGYTSLVNDDRMHSQRFF